MIAKLIDKNLFILHRNKSVNANFKRVFMQMKQKNIKISEEIRKSETQKSQYL